MTKQIGKLSLKELAVFVANKLSEYSIKAVLTGGACVTIYSQNKYQSLDLDFVSDAVYGKKIKAAMEEIGFSLAPGRYFVNPECEYFVEFIPTPLSIGSEPVKKIKQLKTKRGILKLLSPTDCVKDRLAAYFHWEDKQSLEQAIMVAKKQKINFREVRRWAKVENNTEKFSHFLKKLKLHELKGFRITKES